MNVADVGDGVLCIFPVQTIQGICWINAWGNSPSEMPVGGYKASGVGRENGPETLAHYTQTKSVFVSMAPIESAFA